MCKLKTWTVDEMLGEHPCEEYDKEKLTELKAGRKKNYQCWIYYP